MSLTAEGSEEEEGEEAWEGLVRWYGLGCLEASLLREDESSGAVAHALASHAHTLLQVGPTDSQPGRSRQLGERLEC